MAPASQSRSVSVTQSLSVFQDFPREEHQEICFSPFDWLYIFPGRAWKRTCAFIRDVCTVWAEPGLWMKGIPVKILLTLASSDPD